MLKIHNKKGITLVALVITIVIMLILAGVTIGAINGGLFEYAGKAKTNTELTSEKSQIKTAYALAKEISKTTKITEQDLQKQLDKQLGENITTAYKSENGFEVFIVDTNRYYELNEDGTLVEKELIKDSKPANFYYDVNGRQLDGSTNKPYEINCIEDLVTLANLTNGVGNYIDAEGNINEITELNTFSGKNFILTRTLNFESPASYSDLSIKWSYNSEKDAYMIDENSTTNLKEIITDKKGVGFVPISIGKKSFAGNLNGQGFELHSIYENRPDKPGGLFLALYNSTIKNMGVIGLYNIGDGGGFARVSDGAKFYNCYNKVKIKSGNVAAGINGRGSATYINCFNIGELTGSGWAGGIHGSASAVGVTIINCYNGGKISGQGRACNILANGYANGTKTIINCCALGNITSKNGPYMFYGTTGEPTVIFNNCYYLPAIAEQNSSIVVNDESIEITNLDETVDSLNTYVREHKNDYAVPLKEWTIKNGELTFKD